MARRDIPESEFKRYIAARTQMSRQAAAKEAGISYNTAVKFDNGGFPQWKSRAETMRRTLEDATTPEVVPLAKLAPEPKRALEDFGYWRARYLGRLSTPWQEDAAYRVIGWLASPDKEYVVINAPPGSGKSTLFTHDIPCWLACRDRAIRVLIGSRTERQARQYVGRLRRTFDRRHPVQADTAQVELGLAVDGEATLVLDYGRFRPLSSDVWRTEEFIVAQHGDVAVEEKEPTFAAYGMDSGFLGSRANLVVWDDLADKTTLRTAEAREAIRDWWDSEAETRIEPGGVVILQGQRMGPEDIYRHALDQKVGDLDDDESDDRPSKYRHVLYPAHDEERCEGAHSKTAPYWPEGCLLDPRRLPWRELRTIKANREDKYRVLYQQEDLDPASVLVRPVWINGGRDSDGTEHPGCKDEKRSLCELPQGLAGRLLSIATADPSPTKYWGVQWWVVRVDDDGPQERYLMDLLKQTLDAPDFIDWNHAGRTWTGIMAEWQQRSMDLDLPISHWIVEANAAQRFLLQYEHVKRWQAKFGVHVIPHQTYGRNKAHDEFGVQAIAPHYEFGRVRLPWRDQEARLASMKLIEEVTRWPEGSSDDLVMAHWFLEWQLPRLYSPRSNPAPARRPAWLRRDADRLIGAIR